MIGDYKLKVDRRFRCGISCFGMSAGAVVKVTQIDKEYGKVLIHFGGRDTDWFPDVILSDFEKVNHDK